MPTPVVPVGETSYTTNELNQYPQITAPSGVIGLDYDDDGNLTNDGTFSYAYDAENRMIAATPLFSATGSKKLEAGYDYQGRRVSKTVYTYNAGSWERDTTKTFVYDGWNVIQEHTNTGSQTTTEHYVWGLDVSGSLQGAGGIGGLLLWKKASGTFLYLYDANGNVGQLVNAATGALAARYEYDPFGNVLVADGPEAQNNLYRYSTKYYDPETGWSYYGGRYYSAKLGRWPTRDPIEENGGLNLYGFVRNNPVNSVDAIGEKILSMEIRGSGESWIEDVYTTALGPGVWRRHFETSFYREIGAGKKLGLHTGKGYDRSKSWWDKYGWGKGQPVAVGLLKFEAKAGWCVSGTSRPYWVSYGSNVQVIRIDTKTGEAIIVEEFIREFKDGEINQMASILDSYKNPDGTFNSYAWDAPRIAPEFHTEKRYRYTLKGEWRLQVYDNDNCWETKFRLGFSFDDDLSPGTMTQYFEVISPPTQIQSNH